MLTLKTSQHVTFAAVLNRGAKDVIHRVTALVQMRPGAQQFNTPTISALGIELQR